MYSQEQSPFFRLPCEIREQIETEYLAEHLRVACASRRDNLPPARHHSVTTNAATREFSSPLSPLSRSCRRMLAEMRPHARLGPGPGPIPSPSPGPGPVPDAVCSPFALFHVKHATGSVILVEGAFRWKDLRRLRFIHEMEDPGSSWGWPRQFVEIINAARHLAELEFEWNPRMSFVHGEYIEKVMAAIRDHPSIRTVRLRGNAPKPLLESKPDAMPGKRIVVEPLIMWPAKDPAADEIIDRQRAKMIAEAKARVHAHIERLATMEPERRSRPHRCRCLLRRYQKLAFWS